MFEQRYEGESALINEVIPDDTELPEAGEEGSGPSKEFISTDQVINIGVMTNEQLDDIRIGDPNLADMTHLYKPYTPY